MKKNRRSSRSKAAPRRRHVCPLEALESRQLLSAAPAFIEGGGRLVVRGTPGNDKIAITQTPGNSAKIRVTLNSKTYDFAAKAIKQIKVEAGKGNDLIQSDISKGAISKPMYFLGEQGNDTLVTATKDDALLGGGDADVIVARAGNNYVNGGAGNDKLFAGAGNDTLIGEGGTDSFQDAGGNNTVKGLAKNEKVIKAALPTTIPSATSAATPVPPASVEPTPVPTPAPVPPVIQPVSGANPFVIGVWSQPYWSFDKWKARGINTVVGYESLSGTVSVEKFSDEAVKRGLYMIRHPNADPTKDKNQKNLLAWMENDEPDYHNTDPKILAAQYASLKKVDPKKPVFVNFSGSSALWGYGGKKEADYDKWIASADWISNDLYPITAHNRPSALDAPGKAAALLAQWSGGKRQFAVIEASDQQLPGRQLPYPGVTPDQFRAEVFNAVISGATGIIYFPQRIGGGFLFDAMNAQVEAEMKSVNGRLSKIGDALMTTKDPGGASIDVDGSLRATWRKYNGKTYFVVLNNSTQSVVAKMDVKGVSGAAIVDGENRNVQIKTGQITDTFKPLEAHVYVVG